MTDRFNRRAVPPYRSENQQRGMVVPALIVVFVLVGVMVAGLVQHLATNADEAMDEQLGQLRAYWAMSGVVDYRLSRLRAEPNFSATSSVTDTQRVNALLSYANNASVDTLTYVSTIPALVFQASTSVTDLSLTDDGLLQLRLELVNQSTTNVVPAIRELDKRVLPLLVDVCSGDVAVGSRSQATTDCESTTGSAAEHGITTIQAYRRRP